MRPLAAAALLAALAAAPALGACSPRGTLDGSQVEYLTLDGRRFEVRLAPTDVENEYRLLVVRATLVLDPDPDAERERGWNVARRIAERTCRGRPYQTLQDHLADGVNLYVRFRCQA